MSTNNKTFKISIASLAIAAGGVWPVMEMAGAASDYLDARVEEVCEEYVEAELDEMREEIGNLQGQLGEAWMEICDLLPGRRWWRGECIPDD
jgi:hypothetical protein